MKYLLGLIMVLSAIPGFGREHEALPGLGMWAWRQPGRADQQGRCRIVDFCELQGISHVDQHLVIDNGAVRGAGPLRTMLLAAAERGVSVNALRGHPEMFSPASQEQTMEDLAMIVRFNGDLPEHARFAGVKFDVEPYLAFDWNAGGERRQRVILDYLSFLSQIRDYLQKCSAPRLELSVDIPFWWDEPDYVVEFDGMRKPLAHHVIDIVDWVGVMSYRRDPDSIVQLVQGEIDYAASIGRLRSVAPAIEVGRMPEQDAHISFADVPPQRFRAALSTLRERLAGNSYIRHVMLHCYECLAPYLDQTSTGAGSSVAGGVGGKPVRSLQRLRSGTTRPPAACSKA